MRAGGLPTSLESVAAVWSRNFLQFRKSWLVSLFWILLEPLFVLGALGYGLGTYVTQVQGMSYLEFFFPALLCNSAMLVAFFECTYANFTKLSHTRLYHTMLLAPMDPRHLLTGEVLWGGTKSLFSVAGVMVVAAALGAMGSARILMAVPVIFLSALTFAAFGMLVTSMVRNYDQIIYPSSGLIVPLSLFSGTYFPLEVLPKPIQVLAYLSPLTHAVSATRSIQQGNYSAFVFVNVGCLALFFILLARAALKSFERRLID